MYKCEKRGRMVIIFNSKKLNKSLGIFNANELHFFLSPWKVFTDDHAFILYWEFYLTMKTITIVYF